MDVAVSGREWSEFRRNIEDLNVKFLRKHMFKGRMASYGRPAWADALKGDFCYAFVENDNTVVFSKGRRHYGRADVERTKGSCVEHRVTFEDGIVSFEGSLLGRMSTGREDSSVLLELRDVVADYVNAKANNVLLNDYLVDHPCALMQKVTVVDTGILAPGGEQTEKHVFFDRSDYILEKGLLDKGYLNHHPDAGAESVDRFVASCREVARGNAAAVSPVSVYCMYFDGVDFKSPGQVFDKVIDHFNDRSAGKRKGFNEVDEYSLKECVDIVNGSLFSFAAGGEVPEGFFPSNGKCLSYYPGGDVLVHNGGPEDKPLALEYRTFYGRSCDREGRDGLVRSYGDSYSTRRVFGVSELMSKATEIGGAVFGKKNIEVLRQDIQEFRSRMRTEAASRGIV